MYHTITLRPVSGGSLVSFSTNQWCGSGTLACFSFDNEFVTHLAANTKNLGARVQGPALIIPLAPGTVKPVIAQSIDDYFRVKGIGTLLIETHLPLATAKMFAPYGAAYLQGQIGMSYQQVTGRSMSQANMELYASQWIAVMNQMD
jgi:hypothetical protein